MEKYKTYWIGYYCFGNDEIADEIAKLLCNDNFEVELYGVNLFADHLPDNYSIVDFRTRKTLIICKNGEIFDDPDEIEKIESEEN